MSGAAYTVILRETTGAPLRIYGGGGAPGAQDMISLSAAIGLNGVGALTLVLPDSAELRALIYQDMRIEIERSVEDYAHLLGDTAWFVHSYEDAPTAGTVTLFADHAGARILGDRDVAYDAGTSQAEKADQADDMMKAYVRENAGSSATDTDRRLPTTFFTVASDLGLGPSRSKAASRKNLLRTLQEISADSQQQGAAVFFDVVLVSPGGVLEFRTYTPLRGRDRGAEGFRLSEEFGNAANLTVRINGSQERTYVYAAGQGTESDRDVQTASSSATARSAIGRRETTVAAQHVPKDDTGALTAEAQAALWRQRTRTEISGEIQQTATSRYGVEWDLGDLVLVEVRDQAYEARIDTVTIEVRDGRERIRAPLRGV